MTSPVQRRMAVVVVVAVCTLLLVGRPSQAKVNYRCVYGPVRTAEDNSGRTHHFCALGMEPAFMQEGGFVIARDTAGVCYECLCERQDDIGMACCETTCPNT